MSYPRNNDPFQPWNDPMYKDDPFAPHNDPMEKGNPFKAWNEPFGDKKDLTRGEKKDYGMYDDE